MRELLHLPNRTFFGQHIADLTIALAVTVAILLVGILARRVVRRRYAVYSATPDRELAELPLRVLSRTTTLFLLAVAVLVALGTLELKPAAQAAVWRVLTVVFILQGAVWGSTWIGAWVDQKRERALAGDAGASGSFGIIGFVARVVLWTFFLLLALDNLGIDITALVAGLGIGGVAVALAVQNVLGDLFASLSIALDKPFVVGDFVTVGDFMGNVETIGIKSVRLRSLSGEQIVMANADLLNSRVRNYGRMVERRVVFSVGVTYETPRDKLERIPGTIREIVEKHETTRFDRAHFATFGPYSLDFETVYYVLSREYNVYMDTQQSINFAIHAAFEREGIEFAYPTQKLWLERTGADARGAS